MVYGGFSFHSPANMAFGAGIAAELGTRIRGLGKKRALLVSDPGLVRAGVVTSLQKLVEEAGVSTSLFDRVEENPTAETVQEAAEAANRFEADVVVGIGGGSAMDAAKATAMLVTNGGRPHDYEGADRFAKDPLDLVLVPTTAGTGSEATFFAVITDRIREYKMPIASARLAPKLALLDPELTVSMPPRVTAATGMDALTHAIEAYTNVRENPIADTLAREAVRLIGTSLRQAFANGRDLKARGQMLLASYLAGMAFNAVRLGAVHALSHPVGSHFGVPHGVANAILLPYVMQYNLVACPEKFADIAALLGEPVAGLSVRSAAQRAVVAVRELLSDLRMPRTLREVGVSPDAIDALAKEAMASPNAALNPRVMTEEGFKELLREAIDGSWND